MTNPKNISISDYVYSLPSVRIANYPLPERDASKLLIFRRGEITEDIYRNIAKQIPPGSLLFFNNTKVVEARLLFQKSSGGNIEIFCLDPHEQYADITTAMLQKERVWWNCLVGGASKWKPGQILEKTVRTNKGAITLFAKYIEKRTGSFIIELSWKPESNSFAEILHHAGVIPLPPYIKRNAEAADAERYQTVYADQDGSVAAPTAGLHFTEKIFSDLLEKKIETHFVTLHVGAGTFKPVKSETMQDHEMHAEWIDVSKKTIENILIKLNKNIIAVGTTSLRTLESLYWLGVKSRESGVGSRKSEVGSLPTGQAVQESIQLLQWDAYNLSEFNVTVPDALQALLHWINKNNLDRLVAKTQLLITPGYEFKIVKGLITNFHQPQSTLLLLVAALIGNNPPTGQAGWRDVYEYALNNDFRFLSYGDGCLLWHPSASLPDYNQGDKINFF